MKKLLILLATAGLFCTGTASAQDCELSITGNDMLQYNKKELTVSADCEEVTVTLEHTGMLPVMQMGHNWTLTRTADYMAVAQAGQGAGLENDYLPQDDDRILTHTDMVGGGETTSVTFDLSQLEAGGDYTYFCSFPGHWAVMNGKLIIES